jgi:hypothetical protein
METIQDSKNTKVVCEPEKENMHFSSVFFASFETAAMPHQFNSTPNITGENFFLN